PYFTVPYFTTHTLTSPPPPLSLHDALPIFGTVDDIFINCQTVIPSNRSRRRIGWVRFSHHFTCRFYDIFTFPNHCKDWSRSNKVDKVIEKRTFFMFSVMFFG